MDATDLFKDFAHRPIDAAANLPDLSAAQLNAHPGEHPNSIAWLLWHAAREVDVQTADLSGAEQVWTAQHFRERFKLGDVGDSIGYGHSDADARTVMVDDQTVLTDYLEATIESLTGYVDSLATDQWDEVIDENWDPPVTRGVRLVSIIDDAVQHVGQAAYVAGIVEKQA